RPSSVRGARGKDAELWCSAAGWTWAAGLPEGWQQSLAAKAGSSSGSAALAPMRPKHSARASLRETATPPPDEETRLRRHGTAVPLRLSLAASSRFAPATAPTLLRRCGAGLAHTLHNWSRSSQAVSTAIAAGGTFVARGR